MRRRALSPTRPASGKSNCYCSCSSIKCHLQLLDGDICWIICLWPNQEYVCINYRFKLQWLFSVTSLLLLLVLLCWEFVIIIGIGIVVVAVSCYLLLLLTLACQTLWRKNFYLEQLIKPLTHTLAHSRFSILDAHWHNRSIAHWYFFVR